MSKSFVSLFALIVAAAALVVSLTRENTGEFAAAAPIGRGDHSDSQRLTDLENELSALRQRIERDAALVPAWTAAERAPAAADEASTAEVLEAMETRLAAVENSVSSSTTDALPELDALQRALRGPLPEADLGELKIIASDGSLTDEERLRALRSLRFQVDENGADARDSTVVVSMIDVYHGSTDVVTRADVLRQLDGVTDPALLPVLLDALANDPEADVREEAAETLGEYMPDPGVESALRHAAANDADAGVRKEANGSLN